MTHQKFQLVRPLIIAGYIVGLMILIKLMAWMGVI